MARLLSSFLSRMNDSLSVTVVDNEGIITPELFGSSLEKTEPSKSRFDQIMTWLERVHTYDRNDKIHLDSKDIIENIVQDKMHSDISNSTMESHSPPYEHVTESSNNKIDNFCVMEISSQDSDEDKEKNSVFNANDDDDDASIDTESFIIVHNSDVSLEPVNPIQEMSTRLSGICQKLRKKWDDTTSRFNLKTEVSVCDSEIPIKRPYLPRQRKKANIIAMGRGRGRARSQLRCSGVSQTRHRKETKHRTKHCLVMNIQDDRDTWQDIEVYRTVQNDSSPDSPTNCDSMVDVPHTVDFVKQTNSVTIKFSNITFNEEKPKIRNKIKQKAAKYSTRMHNVPDTSKKIDSYHEDGYKDKIYNSHMNPLRSRLISESSADSEDSFCIVFDAESDTNSTIDIIDHDETNCENEDSEDEQFIVQKVKFNLIPIVHTMVQWNYAYRAARKGQWEQMARDRERFRGRINCIAAVLNPILTSQHRTNVWQERFALQE